jgi:hypothetical protein
MKTLHFVAALLCAYLALIPALSYAVTDSSTKPKLSLTVYKSPSCGCCSKWVDHLQTNDFSVKAVNHEDMAGIKAQAGIQAQYQSCHTGFSEQGYVFEGHVPARYVEAFLIDPPAGAIGLAVPAMPVGSPGMEMGQRFQAYKVMLLFKDGRSKVFAQVNTPDDQ